MLGPVVFVAKWATSMSWLLNNWSDAVKFFIDTDNEDPFTIPAPLHSGYLIPMPCILTKDDFNWSKFRRSVAKPFLSKNNHIVASKLSSGLEEDQSWRLRAGMESLSKQPGFSARVIICQLTFQLQQWNWTKYQAVNTILNKLFLTIYNLYCFYLDYKALPKNKTILKCLPMGVAKDRVRVRAGQKLA